MAYTLLRMLHHGIQEAEVDVSWHKQFCGCCIIASKEQRMFYLSIHSSVNVVT